MVNHERSSEVLRSSCLVYVVEEAYADECIGMNLNLSPLRPLQMVR